MLQTDATESAYAKTACRTSSQAVLIATVEQTPEPFIKKYLNEVQTQITSPSYPLDRRKAYVDLAGQPYKDRLAGLLSLSRYRYLSLLCCPR